MIQLILRILAVILFAVLALSKVLEIDNMLLYPTQWLAFGLCLLAASFLPWLTPHVRE